MAKTSRVKKRDFYDVGTGTRDILASVDVGAGQIGTMAVLINKKAIVEEEAPLAPQNLGLGSDLKGKLLIVEGTVTDVSVMTNKMSVIVRLTGGRNTKKVTATAEVADDGDSVFFQVAVLFTA